MSAEKIIGVLYSSGGTADVGRHAVRALLDVHPGKVRVLTRDPKTLLEEQHWKSVCGPYTFTPQELKEKLEVRAVDFATVDSSTLAGHLTGVSAVVSALGNRQPFYGDRVAARGTKTLMEAIGKSGNKVDRVVAVTSSGCNEDWPPMEFHWAGTIFKWMLRLLVRDGYYDLCQAENAITGSGFDNLDYLLVRPVGLGEERREKGEWFIQKKKYQDKLGPDISKMDCARFVVKEALEPTYHKTAVVIGSNPDTFVLDEPPLEE